MNLATPFVTLAVSAAAVVGLGTGTAAAAPPVTEVHADLVMASGQTMHETFDGSAANEEIVVACTTEPGQVQDRVVAGNLLGRLWVINQSDQSMTFTLWIDPSAPIERTTVEAGGRLVLNLQGGSATRSAA